jgi:hypothetical protein
MASIQIVLLCQRESIGTGVVGFGGWSSGGIALTVQVSNTYFTRSSHLVTLNFGGRFNLFHLRRFYMFESPTQLGSGHSICREHDGPTRCSLPMSCARPRHA